MSMSSWRRRLSLFLLGLPEAEVLCPSQPLDKPLVWESKWICLPAHWRGESLSVGKWTSLPCSTSHGTEMELVESPCPGLASEASGHGDWSGMGQ